MPADPHAASSFAARVHPGAAQGPYSFWPRPECEREAADAKRPIAIISARGPSVLSAALAPPKSRLRRTSLLARNLRLPCASDDASDDDDAAGSSSEQPARKRRRRRCPKRRHARSALKPWSLLVADIASSHDVSEVRQALERNPDAHCLVEISGDCHHPCLMTLSQDGFVWNMEAFVDRRSGQFESVARRNPFMQCVEARGQDADGGRSEMVQLYHTTVHEIRDEDCPRLF
ncbi:hypothetical protein LPJ63_000656 [Coemansia sp. RSA 2711]|nr:hypothetical protein LPJ63_000656 [Coemansia sp. RSA 2711]